MVKFLTATDTPDQEPAALSMTGTDGGCTGHVPLDVPAGGKGQGELRTREDISPLECAEGKRNNPLENQGLRTIEDS